MTDRNETDMPDDDSYVLIEAFIDGERVDGEALKVALADAAGRDYLIDLLALRDAVNGMGPGAWSAMKRVAPAMQRFRWAAAAALLVCSIAAGYLVGVRAVEGSTTQPEVAAVINLTNAPPAPTPTKVITLRPGVEWTDSKGER